MDKNEKKQLIPFLSRGLINKMVFNQIVQVTNYSITITNRKEKLLQQNSNN